MNKDDKLFYAAAFGLILLSAATRFFSIGTESYWIDEMVSLHFAKHEQWRAIFWDNAPFLYHLLLKFWVMTFGDSEFATRTLSALFSVSTTAVMIVIGRRLGGTAGGLLTGALHALSGLSILYGQETRMYAMFEFFTALNLFAWLRLTRDREGAVLFAVTSMLMAFTHYLSAVPLAIEAVTVAWLHRERWRENRVALLGAGLALSTVAFSYIFLFSWKYLNWQRLKFSVEPGSRLPADFLWILSNRSWAVGVAFIAMGAWALWKFRKSERRFEVLALFGLFIGPLLMFVASGFALQRAMLLPRYLIFLLPAFTALMGLAANGIWTGTRNDRRIAVALFAVFLAGTAGSFDSIYLDDKASWRDAASLVSRFPGSLVMTTKTEAVQTPYFVRNHIPLKRWDSSHPEAILAETEHNDYVWIVDNYWSFQNYIEKLRPVLDGRFQIKEEVLKEGNREPLYVLQIHRAK